MNNKMATNTCLSTIESKKQTKPTRRTETESWIWRKFNGSQMGVWGNGGRGEGVKNYKLVVTE